MALLPWEELGQETLTRFKVFDVVRAWRRSPRTGRDIDMFVVHTLDWVQVVPVTADGELLMVRQFRQGSTSMSLEIPGGVVSPGEEPALAAARELREETGFEAGELHAIGCVNPNPALFSNTMHAFLATGCTEVGDLVQDPGEDLEVVAMPIDEVQERVRRGEIHSALVLSGLYTWSLTRRP